MQLFKPSEIIWSKDKHAYLVIHVYRNATFVISLEEKGMPVPKVILERDYSNFAKDEDV